MARKQKGEVRKREILDSFYRVIVEEGIEGASIAKIAKKLKIHPSLIIHYFPTKEEMVVALVHMIVEKYESAFLPRIEEVEDPRRRFQVFFDTLFAIEYDRLVDDSVFAMCYYLGFRNEKIREAFRNMFGRLREIVLREIKYYNEKGIIQVAEPEKMADLIIAIEEGLSFMRSVMGVNDRWEEIAEYLKGITFSLLRRRDQSQIPPIVPPLTPGRSTP